MIGTSPKITAVINSNPIPDTDNIPQILGEITNGKTITITPATTTEKELMLRVKTSQNAKEQVVTPSQIGNFSVQPNEVEIAITKIPSGQTWYVTTIYSTKRTSLEKFPLDNLDTIRDNILMTPGDTVFDLANSKMSVTPFINFQQEQKIKI